MGNSLITEEMKAAIGVESEPSVYEIEKEAIRRWTDAIGDQNPLYHDEEFAKKQGYRSLVAPPIFIRHYSFPLIQGKTRAHIMIPLKRQVAGSDGVEVFKTLQAGDKVYQTTKITEIVEKEGRLGKMLIVTSDTLVRSETGEIIAIGRHIEIYY